MNLYKRGRIYWLKYQVAGVVHRVSTHATDYKEARKFRDSLAVARKAPTFEEAVEILRIIYRTPRPGSIALGDIWARYEETARAVGRLTASPRTLYERKRALHNLTEWLKNAAGEVRTAEGITGAIATRYAAHLAKGGSKTKTRANTIGHLVTVWNILEKIGNGIVNPWTRLAPVVTDSERIPAFSVEQERAVLRAAAAVGKDWLPVCTIARHTGLRYGDIAHLKWSEIDFAAGIIHRIPEKTRRYGIAVELPIIAPVRAALEPLRGRGGVYVFPQHAALYRTGAGEEMLPFSEVLDAAGITGRYTFHSWRHTAATRLADAGISTETRKRILGHTEDATADRYDHAAHLEEVKAAMEAAEK